MKENIKTVEADAVFDAYSEKATGLSQELQIDAVRRFDKHFKNLNGHLWWLALLAKVTLALIVLQFILVMTLLGY